MPLRLLVFDLDGTLVDSEEDLAGSVNATLAHLGRSALPLPLIRSYIGDGASMLVRRALGDPEGGAQDERYVTEALTYFLAHYREHKLHHTRTYPGVVEALDEIQASCPGVLMAVLTNKPVGPSKEICTGLGLGRFFFRVYGGDSFHLKKPDPVGLEALMNEAATLLGGLPLSPAEVVMIGDSAVDIATARAAGTRAIGCTFGLAPASLLGAGADALAHSAAEWPAILREL